jgi:hypothetical protein
MLRFNRRMAELAPPIQLPNGNNENNSFYTPRSTINQNNRNGRALNAANNAAVQNASVKVMVPVNTVLEEYGPKPLSVQQLPEVLISQPTFISMIYTFVLKCAQESIKKNMPYRWADITVIGGAALVLYNSYMEGYKLRHEIGDVRNYLDRGTMDIDMTWNMNIHPFVIQSYPKIVKELGMAFVNSINIKLGNTKRNGQYIQRGNSEGLKTIKEYLINVAPSLRESIENMSVVIEFKDMVDRYGSFSIGISFKIDQDTFKIGDLTIHDGFNSQTYNEEHEHLPFRSTPLIFDPTYCTAGLQFYPSHAVPMGHEMIPNNTFLISVENVPIRVPMTTRYAQQQLFSAGNQLLSIPVKEKGYISLQRVVYLIYLISTHNPTVPQNVKNISNLLQGPIGVIQPNIFELYLKKLATIHREFIDKQTIVQQIIKINRPIQHLIDEFKSYVPKTNARKNGGKRKTRKHSKK